MRREGDVPAKVSDVPYRVSTPHSHTALAAPSDFDPLLIERSFTPPAVQVSRDFVYGKSMNLYSGEPVVYLPHSPQEVVYAAASLVVIHDLKNNTQVYVNMSICRGYVVCCMFRVMAIDSSVLSIVVMFHHYWCIWKSWSSFIMLYNNKFIAHNIHTHNGINIFLHLYIFTSPLQVLRRPRRRHNLFLSLALRLPLCIWSSRPCTRTACVGNRAGRKWRDYYTCE